MQMPYRSTRRHEPQPGETLVGSREQALKLIAELDSKLAQPCTNNARAEALNARAVLYSALGDEKMLEAADSAYKFSKTAMSTALYAVALHHFGRVRESLVYYERAYRQPHEQGFEIDIGYSNALLMVGRWSEAWPIIRSLKKRMVYAAHLPEWNGKPCKELSIISEGGFGDIIQNSRFIPLLKERGVEKITVYLPPYFFDHGFTHLAQRQPWFPEMKLLTQVPMKVPAAGFFDLPAILNIAQDAVPAPPIWRTNAAEVSYEYVMPPRVGKPRGGFCYAARAMETPLVAHGIYRDLRMDQADKIIINTSNKVTWVNLQKDGKETFPIWPAALTSWDETAAIIANLDFVLTVDTAVMHIAASLGKPTYVLLSGAVDWKFGMSGDCPWYPSVKLFRNEGFGFDKAVNDVIRAINNGEVHG